MSLEDLEIALNQFIFSVSGWRAIFALEPQPKTKPLEESLDSRIPNVFEQLMIAAGYLLGEFYKRKTGKKSILLALGRDTRPTGPAIEKALLQGLLFHSYIDIAYLGCSAISEITAYTASEISVDGFVYISASHNPAAYNGLKIGLSQGGCLQEESAQELIELYKDYVLSKQFSFLLAQVQNSPILEKKLKKTLSQKQIKTDALNAYFILAQKIGLAHQPDLQHYLKEKISSQELGIVAEMNGSARICSIDFDFFRSLGLKLKTYNTQLGDFNHTMVPEGEGLKLCCQLLKEEHRQDPSFLLGYVPDCDGDRGNLVFYNEKKQICECLEAQTGFSLVVVAQLSFHLWQKTLTTTLQEACAPVAIVVNDATSLRIEEIAQPFLAQVFRCEVGEANVVALADQLQAQGYDVLILGEGSNGGSIIPPSRVRDPLYTVCSCLKLLAVKEIYQQWFHLSNLIPPSEPSIIELLEKLPTYTTTSAFEGSALLKVTSANQAKLKSNYIKLLDRSWQELKQWLPELSTCSPVSYEGLRCYPGQVFHQANATGGLKIILTDLHGMILGSLWMRRSKTEPVFRLLVDLKGRKSAQEQAILAWHKNLLRQADCLTQEE